MNALPDWMQPQPPASKLSPAMLEALREIREREKAQSSLSDYARQVVGVIPAQHHMLICDALDDGVINDEWDDLVVCMPPGSAKSTYVSHCFPAWFLGKYPDKNVILASHTASLAEKWSRRVRDTLNTTEHAHRFADSSLSKDSTAVARWSTSRNGEFLAAGVGMSILGFRADLVVLDDPISGFEQAQSVTQLQKVHDWYKSDLKSRLKPRAKIVTVCQRTAAWDMAGYIMKEFAKNPTRRLRVINIPMVATTHDDALGRSVGDRLWPEWYTAEMVEDLRKDDFVWRTMWQQEPPSDDGEWVSTSDIRFRPTPTTLEKCYGMSDLALSVNTGDYTVHFIVAVDHNGDWDIVEGQRARVDVEQSSSTIVQLCATYKPIEWLIDDDNASKVFGTLVGTKARQLSVPVPWRPMPMRGQDKETRAASLRGMFKRGRVYMPPDAPFTKWLTNELLTFPNAVGSGVDDGIDALGLIGRRMLVISAPVAPVAPRPLPTLQDMTLNQLWEDNANRTSSYLRI